ncbi:MAG: mechanosensitive ion channel [Xanthomonadales bacterium]|nr:mechanosensitive ion channel [Xanthomonadales bacterium]NIN59959.1 mechanosensitive ion channel [Xanthomonadales bacterium]NIN75333.1 mechanosensitive ion channel [Xanthomonadales bacterium]NIO13502.1 mechanosensitive ion channel [Xanthomonadales bacterium]NIP12352.1 mechanosensitive ion channel [Xanthomonadales bacterium]
METIKAFLEANDLQQIIVQWGLKALLALAIFVVGRWIARFVNKALRRLLTLRAMDETLIAFLANLVYITLLAAVIIAALDALGFPVTSLLAVVGAAGLAVGLALKDSLANFASGVMLVMFRPFGKGDYVEVAGTAGSVEEIRIFNTVLKTPDNKRIIIPNGQVAADKITNYTAMDKRRVDLVIGVGYDDDLKAARGVLNRVCAEHPLVLDDPAPSVFLLNLGESSVDFAVRPWARTEDYWAVYSDVLENAKSGLEAAGCSIPYPQRDVHLHPAN